MSKGKAGNRIGEPYPFPDHDGGWQAGEKAAREEAEAARRARISTAEEMSLPSEWTDDLEPNWFWDANGTLMVRPTNTLCYIPYR